MKISNRFIISIAQMFFIPSLRCGKCWKNVRNVKSCPPEKSTPWRISVIKLYFIWCRAKFNERYITIEWFQLQKNEMILARCKKMLKLKVLRHIRSLRKWQKSELLCKEQRQSENSLNIYSKHALLVKLSGLYRMWLLLWK